MEQIATAVASQVIGSQLNTLLSGKPKAPEIPQAATPPVRDIPAPASGGVDSIAAANTRRRNAQKLQSRSGQASTVLSEGGRSGSLGAG